MKNEKEILDAIAETTKQINEVLAKSGYALAKNDEENEMPPQESEVPDEAPAPEAAQAPEGEPEGQPEDGAPAPEGEQEGQPEGDGMAEELKAHAKEMSDEELEMLLQILMTEHESRSAPSQEGEAPAPEAAPAPEMPEGAEKSMKEDMSKLSKSMETVVSAMEKIAKEVENLKTKKPVASAKPAATNRPVQVLEKSDKPTASKKPEGQRLTKSQTHDFLQNEIRKGNKSVDSGMAIDALYKSTDEELYAYQDELVAKGISLPRL